MRVRQTYLVGLLLFICWSCTDTVKFDRLASNASCSTPSGVLDTSFGTSGAVQVDNPLSYLNSNKTDLINSMIADSSGSIFVTGKTWDDDILEGGGGTNFNFFIGKYNSSLQVDTTFGGGDGFVEKSEGGISAEEVGNDIKLLSTGEIITTGSILNGGTTDILISKWDSNGAEISSVTIDGIGINDCATTLSRDDAGNALAVDSSDNLYITGYCLDDSGDKNFLVIKTNSAGTIDSTNFGTAGVWNFSPGLGTESEEGRDIVLTKSGSLIVGGTRERGDISDTLLVKLTPEGVPDDTFAGGGIIDGFLDDEGGMYKGQINALVLDSDENIYAAGRTYNGSNWDMTVWKYTPSGILDTSWGTSGRYVFNNDSQGNAFDIKIDPCSGNIIVFGFIKSIGSTREDSTIWRLSKTGSLDTSFGPGSGYVSNSLMTENNDRANSGIITSGGKYITGGRVKEDTSDTGCGAGSACDLYFTVWE